jgi:outer membrane protein OmpA-like peptidoglycan-associated protein
MLAVVTAHPVAGAPLPGFDLERLDLNPAARRSQVMEASDLLPEGMFRLSLATGLQTNPLELSSGANRLGALVAFRSSLVLSGAYGVTRWLELAAWASYVPFQGGDNLSTAGIDKPDTSGLGTVYGQGRVGIFSTERGHGVDLSLRLAVGLPTGSAGALAGEDGPTFIPKLGLGIPLDDGWSLAVEAGTWLRPKTTFMTGTSNNEIGSQVILGAGAQYQASNLRGEIAARTFLGLTDQMSGFEVLGGVVVPINPRFDLTFLAGPGVGETPGTPSFRALVGVSIVPLRPQGEQTRVVADDDVQTSRPLGYCDNVFIAIPARCPDHDFDNDGVRNADDTCPDTAEDRDEFSDEDGCPDPDNDLDEILDKDDACPNQPGVVDHEGCPVPDTDGDGVEDSADSCLNEPGVAPNHGCPARRRQPVVIMRDRLAVEERIEFSTGRNTVAPQSARLVEQIARLLGEHPEIAHVYIEGHTDSQGQREANLRLSQARADALREALIDRGVAPARLTATGYGPDEPIDSNRTRKGRESNRRVELNFNQRDRAGENQ